jgi:hypothetical protein
MGKLSIPKPHNPLNDDLKIFKKDLDTKPNLKINVAKNAKNIQHKGLTNPFGKDNR